jgi:hypothetical protein
MDEYFPIASMKADESGWFSKGGHNFLSIFWHDRTRLSRAFFFLWTENLLIRASSERGF